MTPSRQLSARTSAAPSGPAGYPARPHEWAIAADILNICLADSQLSPSPTPRLSRAFRDRLRQHFFYLEKFGIQRHMETRKFDSAGGLYRHLRGLIDYANMVDQPYASALPARLNALQWDA